MPLDIIAATHDHRYQKYSIDGGGLTCLICICDSKTGRFENNLQVK